MSRDRAEFVTRSFGSRHGLCAVRRQRLRALRANSLAGSLEDLVEEVAEALRRPAVGIQPHGRQQLPARTLVLDARLEPPEKPSIDIVRAHTPDVGICAYGDERGDVDARGYSRRAELLP